MNTLPIYIVKGVTMRLTRSEIENLHLEVLGALHLLDESRALEALKMVDDEEPESHLEVAPA